MVCVDFVPNLLSLFNVWMTLDTFSNLTLLNPVDGITSYNFSERGIAWPGEAKKYSSTSAYNLSEIIPPPNWAARYPTGYNSSNFPDLRNDEHFQNWMRTAGLPTFSKLYGRNVQDKMAKGTYRLTINLSMRICVCDTSDLLIFVAHRFPRQIIQGHEVRRYFHCVVGWGQKSVPGMGLCCCSWDIRSVSYRWSCATSHQTKVGVPFGENLSD